MTDKNFELDKEKLISKFSSLEREMIDFIRRQKKREEKDNRWSPTQKLTGTLQALSAVKARLYKIK
jgi:hypothetical protein